MDNKFDNQDVSNMNATTDLNPRNDVQDNKGITDKASEALKNVGEKISSGFGTTDSIEGGEMNREVGDEGNLSGRDQDSDFNRADAERFDR